jgi:hypothetical protein
MICSSNCAGEFQSTLRICRKPGLNQLPSRCSMSCSTPASAGWRGSRSSSARRSRTMAGGAAWGAVQPAEQLLPRRLGRLRQRDQVGAVRRRLGIGQRGGQHLLRVGREVTRQVVEEAGAGLVGQRVDLLHDARGDAGAVGLAALGQQAAAILQQRAQQPVGRAAGQGGLRHAGVVLPGLAAPSAR